LRALANRPLYACVTILVLALAIGANTTVFSIFNGLFLRPLPYPDDDRLVLVYNTYPQLGVDIAGTSIPDYLDRREQARSLERLAIFMRDSRTLGSEGPPEQLRLTRASPSLFEVLGVAPLLGRVFTEDEAVDGNDNVAMVSHAFWNTRLGARPDAVGRDILLDGEPFRVIGVMAPRFGFPDRDIDVWIPFALTPEQTGDDRRGMEFAMSVGRLRPGATVEALNAEMDAIVRRNIELGRERELIDSTGFTGRAESLREMAVGDLEQMLLILQAIVLAVLLMACANVANLQLARTAARRKELAVRAALGADSRRLARLVMIESLVLALAGAVAGLAVTYGGLELVRALGLDRASEGFEYATDVAVLAFTAGIAILASLGSAIFPLMALLREDVIRAVHEAGRGGGGGRTMHRFRSALVVVQIAVSVALLVGAGLLTKSFYQLQREDTGFDAENVWTARIALPESRYVPGAVRFYERAFEELRALPGVIEAGFTTTLPFSGASSEGSYAIDGYSPRSAASEPHAHQRVISEGYLPSLDIPLIMGRNFNTGESERVAIVDELFVEHYFPGGDVLGQRIRSALDGEEEWFTIVGVVPAVKHAGLGVDPTKETIYWHYRQRPRLSGMLTLHTTLPPEQLARVASDAIRRIDPDVPLMNAMSMDARVRASMGPQRTPMVLTVVFAAVAFTLAVIGVYGVLTWTVTQRVGEIGVRMAFGARARDIVGMILTQGAKLTVLGLGIGIAAAVGLGSALSSQLYEVSAADPGVFAVTLIGLAAAALLASWQPAKHASRISPMQALREE
jgi:predicted permease